MVRNHETNMIADLKVQRVDIVNVRYADKADQREFTALITASAKDYYIDDRTQKFLRGDEQPAEFQEFWTFHRQGDSWLLREIEQTRESDALKDENFFEQFTQHQLQQLYGEVAGKEGQVGPWLEKSVETKATKIEKMLNFLVQTDKLWDRPQMIERARQVFTNVHLAEEAAEEPAVRTEELFPQVADLLRVQIRLRKAQGITVEYRNLCIRKVELILVRNFADNSQDEYTTRISAHAQRILRKNGQVTSQDEYVTPFEEYWTFGRLDRQWKLKEVLPPSRGQREAEQENLDQDSSPAQLQWYYRQERAV
jgi:predicted lipid-binding transport protein (Tim44 family)